MSAALLPYWRIFLSGFRAKSTYRMAALAGLFTNAIFGFLKAAILLSTIHSAGGALAGYDLLTMSSYVWWSQALIGAVNLHGGSDLAQRIKQGDVVVDLIRPVNLSAAMILREVGGGVFTLLPRGLPMLVLGALTIGIATPASPVAWVLTPLSVLLAISVSVAAVYALTCSGFWLVETRGLQILYMVVAGFLAGLFVPLALLPHWLQVVAHSTPFPAMLMSAVSIGGGLAGTQEALRLVAVQLAWLLGLVALGAWLTRAGLRRLEVQGG